MMGMLWVVFLVALSGCELGFGLPVGSTPHTYPHDSNVPALEGWAPSGWYAVVPALALLLTAVGLLFGCTWCYKHKDCKPNEGADNQLFTASATQLHDGRRSQPPDSGFSEPANNNISEDNNNGPISLREMQNIANNNATAYIVSENEERNRGRESVVEFEPLPNGIRVVDPLEHCADWFGGEDFPRNRLQYLREIGRGWFGRVVEGEIEEDGTTSTVAVKILNQNASLEDKARFLDEAKMYRDVTHENILAFIAKCLHEDPWILLFEYCSMDLQQFLEENRPKMAILNENGVPLQLMCDISSALAYLHSRGYIYGNVCTSTVLVRNAMSAENARAVLGSYSAADAAEFAAPETRHHPPLYTPASEVWSLGAVIQAVCAWGAAGPARAPPALPCLYRDHLYQVMQLCWNPDAQARPTAAQVHALLNHLHSTHAQTDAPQDSTSDFEERWQRLKPNTIPKIDEHIAIVHVPSTSMASHFTGSDQDFDNHTVQDTLSVDMDTAVSRSSSIMSDKDQLSVQIKSESLNNLHGSLEDVRNIYLTHNEMAALECHQGNMSYEDREKDHDRSDSSVDPWLKDIIAGSQDDVSYYKDVSDVIKNLDNILNSEKTSSSESSHQASPSRDNLSLDCKKEYPVQSSMVKSPGISNFQNILQMGYDSPQDAELIEDDEVDRDTIGTLSHSFERHSDTTSQHTLENLTPDTPIKDMDIVSKLESQIESAHDDPNTNEKIREPLHAETELPKDKVEYSVSKLPNLKDLCVVSCSVSATNEQLNVREDCETSCDNNVEETIRTDEVNTKSIDNNVQHTEHKQIEEKSDSLTLKSQLNEARDVEEKHIDDILTLKGHILPALEVNEVAMNLVENEILQPAIEIVSKMVQETNFQEEHAHHVVNSVNNVSNDAILPPSDLINTIEIAEQIKEEHVTDVLSTPLNIEKEKLPKMKCNESFPEETPNLVQIEDDSQHTNINEVKTEKVDNATNYKEDTTLVLPSETVQIALETIEDPDLKYVMLNREDCSFRSDNNKELGNTQQSTDSTVYMDMDLINDNEKDNRNEMMQDNNFENKLRDAVLSQASNINNASSMTNESTVYLDLPSMLKETSEFLHSERVISSKDAEFKGVCASTPKGSENNTETTLESSTKIDEELLDTKVAEDGPGVTVIKQEQRRVSDHLLSPFDSPTKSHPTDTYDENSSVLLGPFENCSTEVFKGVVDLITKSDIDLPKEELLAFSSNFSEINLETPSPLRDGNFLNEVPDIVPDDVFEDGTVSEAKPKSESKTDTDETDQSGTTKHVSPSTPPNSPGIYLASTSQQKYLVDIDFDAPEPMYVPIESDSGLSSLQKEIDLNQIELQITSKLAMAENENNMNIEYSGPLTVEGLVSGDDMILRDSESVPDMILAGNGGSIEDLREGFTLDEECVKALRNELELKLPLAQVAAIEPAVEEWAPLPPPPELVVSYCPPGAPAALSPIEEETRHQLNAYENDWNTSTRTDSSESYPEPCNNSTDDITELPTAPEAQPTSRDHSTYTVHSRHNDTYSVPKDMSSKELTMSADSLNGSPYKKPVTDPSSPIDDKTYTKDEKESNLERISQVSPCILSPTTESTPGDSDNATRVSTLSKTTAPTDAKHSKPSDCLSKATSIDSWCSNDTLYNVEENFDDLAMDPDIPLQFEENEDVKRSDSTDTLTHHDDEKDASHCSTYIIHDSKSEPGESFSPDSITANDNNTYTKIKTEATGATPSVVTKSLNDSTKDTQTKDLAYGTLPSHSNCSTNIASGIEDPWKLPQPELVRRSPVGEETSFTTPRLNDGKEQDDNSPLLATEPRVHKMDSVDITCLKDDLTEYPNKFESPDQGMLIDVEESPKCNYNSDMAPSVTSTPLVEPIINDDSVEIMPINILETDESKSSFQMFLQSAEIRPQDLSSNYSNEHVSANQDTDLLLEADSRALSNPQDVITPIDVAHSYTDFDSLTASKSQDTVKSGESESASLGDFRQFEGSVRSRPQDLSVIDASSLLLNSERQSYDYLRIEATDRTNLVEGNTDLTTPNVTNTDNTETAAVVEVTPTYSDFESSAVAKPQDVHSRSSHSESGMSSGDFRIFESSVKDRPQDLSSPTDSKATTLSCEPLKNITFDTECDRSNEPLPVTNPRSTRESQPVDNIPFDTFLTNLDTDEETEQPHSIIITEIPREPKESRSRPYEITTLSSALLGRRNDTSRVNNSPNATYDSHEYNKVNTFNSHICDNNHAVNGFNSRDLTNEEVKSSKSATKIKDTFPAKGNSNQLEDQQIAINGALELLKNNTEMQCNGSENFATENFISVPFEELLESNVDEDRKEKKNETSQEGTSFNETKSISKKEASKIPEETPSEVKSPEQHEEVVNGVAEEKVTSITESFLENEKKYCHLDTYLPLLNDIRFTGPASEIMSTSFTQDSPTEPSSPEREQDKKADTAADIVKEWDSDSESQTSNSSSGEFIWKDGEGHETPVVPSTHFDHRGGTQNRGARDQPEGSGGASEASASGDSGSGSEGDEVEFVPSSWDCRAAPSKSSLRSLEQAPPDSKKRVVFKRQKYHCVYEYPREIADVDTHSPAYLPDLSTYCDWDPTSAEEAELGYGQLFGGPSPLDLYPLRASLAIGADYDEDFFISSSARPFESLGIMSTTSQFFPGKHIKPSLLEQDIDEDHYPAPPSPLIAPPVPPLTETRTPSLDFTTPDSGVEDITPGSTTTEEDFKTKKLTDDHCWRPSDSASSSESVSPSSPGGEALGGLRHTRDKLKLDLPPSPHVASPRHNRVFNFVLDKPQRRRIADPPVTPLVMTDETPVINALPLPKDTEDLPVPEPTFSTFGKCRRNSDPEQKMILDEVEEQNETKEEKAVETVKGEGTVLDSGDEDSGIESSSKATLERKTPNVS